MLENLNVLCNVFGFTTLQQYDNKWCNPGLYGADNTMCIYEEGPVAACGDVKVLGVKDQVINYLQNETR